MTTNDRNRDDAAIEQLLLALDVEAESLSSDVTDSLAVARRHATNNSRVGIADSSCLSRRTAHTAQRRDKGTTEAHSSQNDSQSFKWKLAGRDFFGSLQFNHPFTTAIAGIGVASLTAMMVFGEPAPHNTQEDLLAMTSPDSLDTVDKPSAQDEHPALQAVAFEMEPDKHLPLISSEESLDLVGSVDFLLWLDSQQG